MRILAHILKDCLTVKNGNDFCAAKTGAFLSLLIYFPMSWYMLYKEPVHFSLSEFALGVATIIGAGMLGAKVKESTEQE